MDFLALVLCHGWRAHSLVASASEPKFMELPQQTCKRLVIGHRLATDRAKIGRKGSYANAHIG
jgi:hypothetical protein